jgi:hypothetical protein
MKSNNDLSQVNVKLIRLQISCYNNRGMIWYNITNQSTISEEDNVCRAQTTLDVNHTNTISFDHNYNNN